jgi:hypothetical protein
MDLASVLILGVVPFLAGAGILLYVWWCWSGRSRRWGTRVFMDLMVLWCLPTMGVFLVAFAVKIVVSDPAGDLLVAVATAVGLLGFVALLFEPRWWGPRWYHDLQASNPQPDLRDPLTAVSVSSTVPAPFSSDRKAAHAFGETSALAWWRGNYVHDPDTRHREHGLAVPGAVGGHLTLYPGGLTFAASATEDSLRDQSTVVVVPGAEVTGAWVVPARAGADGVVRKGWMWRSLYPRLVVDTRAGPLLFEVAGARAKAAKITATLGLPASTAPDGRRVRPPILPPPPPPPGQGERLASWGMTRYARWRELLAGLVIMVALAAPIVGWYRERASWVIVACIIGPTWLLLLYGFPPRSISVGRDWLRVRSTRADDWVRTDQLAKLSLEVRVTGGRYLAMEDRDGRKLRVDLSELSENPHVVELFLSAVRRARSRGLAMNKGTAKELGLPLKQ